MSEKLRKPLWRRILKWSLLSLLSFLLVIVIGVGIVVNFVFTPSKLTPLVERITQEYLNAEVHFSGIELTFFSTFPDFGVQIKDVEVISGVFRDTTMRVAPVAQDSLMSMKSCLVTINPLAYLVKNRIVVKDFVLEQPEIYAYVDTAGVANWDIVRLPADSIEADSVVSDTSDFDAGIRLKNVRIRQGRLTFDDRNTRLYTRLVGLNLDVDGYLGIHRSRLKINCSTENILFWQEGKLLVNHLALGIETGMKINRDSLLYTLDKAVFDVNGIRFGAGGTLRGDSVNRTVEVNLKYGIHIPSLKTLLDLVPDTILRKAEEVKVRGEVSCRGEIRGLYGKKNIPLLTAGFSIKDGGIAYPGMPSKIDTLDMDFYALIDLQKEQESYFQLRHFCMKGGKTDIDIEGNAENLLTAPVVKAKIDAFIDFDDLTHIFPLADGITCKGMVNTSLKADVLVADVVNANYGKLKIGGWCQMKEVKIFIPKDSIVMNVKSAGIAFSSNRKNENTLQGIDLLNGVVGYSGLEVYVQNKVKLTMDTTYLTLKTSPLKDTSVIASVSSSLHLGRMIFIVRDTLLVGLKSAAVKATLSPWVRNKKIPQINASLQIDSLRLRSMGNRLRLAKAEVVIEAIRSKRNTKIWFPVGYIDFQGLQAYTPGFPIRMQMPGTRLHFDRNEIQLDSAVLRLGHSDVRLTGKITNLAKTFFKKEDLKAELAVTSDRIDCNQLIKALEVGTSYMEKVKAGFRDTISSEEDDMEQVAVMSDSAEYTGSSSLFMIPKGIDLTFQTDIKQMSFGKLMIYNIHGEVVMRNQCIELSDLEMRSSSANMSTSAIYRATDTVRAYTGFSMQMRDIQIDSLVRLIPSLDTLFPMLRSFEGVVDFHIAADSWLDSTMTIELPTLRAAAYLDGKDLVLMDGETFSEISKMLMFKNKKRNIIDSVSVELTVKDGTVEVFPFLVEIDRYKAAIGGEHHIDMTFNYHISILKSPLPFRAGVDISGSLDKMKFRITKAKYKDLFIPSRKAKVDSTQLNLKQRIRKMLHENFK
ncbi:MAG: AsmA family protein [Odoribacter sp.]